MYKSIKWEKKDKIFLNSRLSLGNGFINFFLSVAKLHFRTKLDGKLENVP